MLTLLQGDCLHQLATLPDNSIDSIVTDPPYGLAFMGKKWDYDVPDQAVWEQCLRVLKPGGHLLAFAGSRTYHRMAVRVEDAGFEIRDQIMWVYGSGFPKSANLKEEWEGWGSALKPAHEPIVMARKPFKGSLAKNVLAHGTGALNIDASRVPPTGERLGGGAEKKATFADAEGWSRPWMQDQDHVKQHAEKIALNVDKASAMGRWPANVIHDGSECIVDQFPTTKSGSGNFKKASSAEQDGNQGSAYGAESRPAGSEMVSYGDAGSAARFFYCAKAAPAERHAAGENKHPTVKPLALMEYLVTLVTPPGGRVLDPFMGSGTTGVAAISLGFAFTGVELDPDYFEIAFRRISMS